VHGVKQIQNPRGYLDASGKFLLKRKAFSRCENSARAAAGGQIAPLDAAQVFAARKPLP
jgi:hypothetical protein